MLDKFELILTKDPDNVIEFWRTELQLMTSNNLINKFLEKYGLIYLRSMLIGKTTFETSVIFISSLVQKNKFKEVIVRGMKSLILTNYNAII